MPLDMNFLPGTPTTDTFVRIWPICTHTLLGAMLIAIFLMKFCCALLYLQFVFHAVRLATMHLLVLFFPLVLRSPFLSPSVHLRHPPLPSSQPDQVLLIPLPRAVDSSIPVFAPSQTVNFSTCAVSVKENTLLSGVLNLAASNSSLSPVQVSLLARFLLLHPDREVVDYVLRGLHHGFSIGFQGNCSASASKNLRSAYNNFDAVTQAVQIEVSRQHTAGPFISPPLPNFHCSPIGAVGKSDGTVRLILDLSSPRGSSINEGIDPALYSVKYCSFDDALDLLHFHGRSAFMVKADIKHAFRLCPVSPTDWHLLGYSWRNFFYFDVRLPFGSRSSPYIFNTFANLLCWVLQSVFAISYIIHYLDDFFLCHASYSECVRYRDRLTTAFSDINVPLAEGKLIGPTTVLTFLGIEIDTISQTIKLPADKFNALMIKLEQWRNKKKCTKRELLSLIGSLSFACKVVKSGRLFLRRLIDLSTTVHRLHHHITLNKEAMADIKWWVDFVPSWHGVELIQPPPISSVDISLATDASSLGIGAVYGDLWFSFPLHSFSSLKFIPSDSDGFDINFWELFALVTAVFTWGEHWVNKQVVIFVDNLPITFIWLRGSKSKSMMHLVRHLFSFTATHNINILLKHIPGHSNHLADPLSRLQVRRFRQLHPSAAPLSTPIPDQVWLL